MNLILCQGETAKTPFILKNPEIKIYTYEELCYLILKYPEEMSDYIADEALFEWINTSLWLGKLASSLMKLSAESAALSRFAIAILSYGGYPSNADVNYALTVIRKLENISPKERDKMRADKMAEEGKCFAAISLYRRIIDKCEFEERPLLGKLWHNMGSCYAKMFIFETARACYEKAFHFSGSSESHTSALLCSYILYGDREYDTDIKDIDLRTWYEFEDMKKNTGESEKVAELYADLTREMRAVKEGYEGRFFDIYKIKLDELKNDYIKRAEYGSVS